MRILSSALALLLAAPIAAHADDPERVATLIHLLDGEDPVVREAAARELLDIGRPAQKALREAATSGDTRLRERVDAVYPFVRWGVRDDCPLGVLDVLGRFESSDAAGKRGALFELARSPDTAAREALHTAWWDVDDPALLAELASATVRNPYRAAEEALLDPDEIERRLSAVSPEDHPEALRARAEARLRSGDAEAACELFARVPAHAAGRGLLTIWAQALFQAGRYDDAADVLGRVDSPDCAAVLLRAECLYRAGRREEAEAALTGFPQEEHEERQRDAWELALSHESAHFVAEHSPYLDLAARAWIRLGDLERAEEAWREVQDVDERLRVLGFLLEARGDGGLLTPSFVAETLEPRLQDALRHARLAGSFEAKDPAVALREWKKARLLEPSVDGCAEEIERLGAHASDAAGCRSFEAASPPAHLLFATTPVRLGDFYYYMNDEGTLLKVADPIHPIPAWSYRPPIIPTAQHRGVGVGGFLPSPVLARRGNEVLALFGQSCWYTDPRSGRLGWHRGHTLCVLDEATGREVWRRDFPAIQGQARLWPEEGVLTIQSRGLAVFDLATRSWRWTLPQGDRGGPSVWVRGDALYLGFDSGDLCRLRLADGSLVWKKTWPGGPVGRVLLHAAGTRLLYRPAGGRLVAVSLEDDSVLWEMQPRDIAPEETVVDGDCVYLTSASLRCVQAVSLADGRVVWETTLRHAAPFSDCTVTKRALWFGRPGELVCLDRETGRVVGIDEKDAMYGYILFAPDGETLYASDRNQHSPDERRPMRPPRLYAARLVPGGAVEAPYPKDEDPVAEVSLLEDVCYGPASRSGEDWLALADACVRAGHAAWGAEALRRGLVLTRADLVRVREWRARVAQEQEEDTPPREEPETDEEWEAQEAAEDRRERLVEELKELHAWLGECEEDLDIEQAFLSGELPPRPDGAVEPLWEYTCLVLDADAEVTVRRAVLLGRSGRDWDAIPIVMRRLGEVPEPLALEGIGVVIRGGVGDQECTRLWGGSRMWGSRQDATDLEESLRTHLPHAQGALRGAVLAVLDLLGAAIPEEGADASLRAALGATEPHVRLAAAATLARRGDDVARQAILEAIDSTDKEQRRFAVWLAGNLCLSEAAGALGPTDLEALAQIGTPEAVAKLLKAAEAPNAGEAWGVALSLARVPSEASRGALVRIGRTDSLTAMEIALYGLAWMDTRESRLAALEFARGHLRLGALRESALPMMARGLLEEGDVAGAERYLTEWEATAPPSITVLALRARVLAAKGDLDGARAARDLALGEMDRLAAIEPVSSRRLVVQAMLYLEPEAIADRATASRLLDDARRLAPHDPEVARLIESLDPR